MRIAILTSGRFHVCDLARELDALGHEVAFYSYVPKRRTRAFGLPDRCNRCLLPYVAPILAARRLARSPAARSFFDHQLTRALDRVAARIVGPCDVFIGMSGMALASAEAVRKKYGAKVWIERGSRHILSQREILDGMPNRNGADSAVADWAVRRELATYELADTIVIPSLHVERSFVERGIPSGRIFRNPYGVDLRAFPPTEAPPPGPPTIVAVGQWSLRKGADVLVDAWRTLDRVRLLHVGPVVDAPLPAGPHFEHHPPVDQPRLKEFYGRAHLFVLASREEGLSLVQAQALSCGLPVVCTDRTGGEDLGALLRDPSPVTVVAHGDPAALADALRLSLDRACRVTGVRDLLGPDRKKVSWREYGRRYDQALWERA